MVCYYGIPSCINNLNYWKGNSSFVEQQSVTCVTSVTPVTLLVRYLAFIGDTVIVWITSVVEMVSVIDAQMMFWVISFITVKMVVET